MDGGRLVEAVAEVEHGLKRELRLRSAFWPQCRSSKSPVHGASRRRSRQPRWWRTWWGSRSIGEGMAGLKRFYDEGDPCP